MALAGVVTWVGANRAGDTSPCTTAAQTTTGANLIVVTVSSNVTITSVTDSKSNTYTQVTGSPVANSGGDNVSIWYTFAPSVGASHTISANWASGTAHTVVCARAYSGAITSPADKYAESTGSSSSLSSSATATTSQADELLVCAGTVSSGSAMTFTGTGGFTAQSQFGDASISTVGFLADRIVTSAAAYTGTVTSTQSGAWSCSIATFKGETSGGGGGLRRKGSLALQGVGR